jgi:diguanylate cyclase (GGDEF)-like protein
MEPAEASLLVLEDGSELAVRESAAPIIAENEELVGAVLVFTNVSQLRSLQQRMEHLASHDPLTGLINRREFELRLADAISDAGSSLRQHILCYLDLDEFKLVNDTCGHGAGDELLRQLTSVMSSVIPKGNTLARLGGDEFGILFMNCDPDEATSHAQSLLDAVRQYRFQWEGQIFEVAASIGIVPVVGGNGNLAELLSAADSACYVAKDRGRNQIHVTRIDDSAVRVRHTEMLWVERINRALHEDRFRLFKQPIRPLQKRDGPQYHELLLRLVDIEGKIVAPSQFITAAERYRMMPVIDLWVVGAALNSIGTIANSADEITAAFTINLSGQSFGNAELKTLILEQLDQFQIPPGRVMFEITETAAISNLSQALEFMNTLRERGCRFILDDFGSGLSSFRYLKSLDIEFLKIDGELVREIARDPIQREMVAAIHRIGESMGIQTIGEWVENSEIEQTLVEIGVDYAQGWGVGRPEPFEV